MKQSLVDAEGSCSNGLVASSNSVLQAALQIIAGQLSEEKIKARAFIGTLCVPIIHSLMLMLPPIAVVNIGRCCYCYWSGFCYCHYYCYDYYYDSYLCPLSMMFLYDDDYCTAALVLLVLLLLLPAPLLDFYSFYS